MNTSEIIAKLMPCDLAINPTEDGYVARYMAKNAHDEVHAFGATEHDALQALYEKVCH